MPKIIPVIQPEDALKRLMGIESLGDAMEELMEMGPLPAMEFAKLNAALLVKHGMMEPVELLYFECVRRDENFAGPEEYPTTLCNECVDELITDDRDPHAEFARLSEEPLPFENIECEVCGR